MQVVPQCGACHAHPIAQPLNKGYYFSGGFIYQIYTLPVHTAGELKVAYKVQTI